MARRTPVGKIEQLTPAEQLVINLSGQLSITEQVLRTLVERLADEELWHKSTQIAYDAAQELLAEDPPTSLT